MKNPQTANEITRAMNASIFFMDAHTFGIIENGVINVERCIELIKLAVESGELPLYRRIDKIEEEIKK